MRPDAKGIPKEILRAPSKFLQIESHQIGDPEFDSGNVGNM